MCSSDLVFSIIFTHAIDSVISPHIFSASSACISFLICHLLAYNNLERLTQPCYTLSIDHNSVKYGKKNFPKPVVIFVKIIRYMYMYFGVRNTLALLYSYGVLATKSFFLTFLRISVLKVDIECFFFDTCCLSQSHNYVVPKFC